jgi:thioredoxin-dependent peroxiredoxin
MTERTFIIKDKSFQLIGTPVKEGDKAPDFAVVAPDFSEKKFADYRGKVCVIASVPSLDTSVCDRETKRFNDEAASLSHDVAILTISMDLPYAQRRWCGAVDNLKVNVLSDHRDADFGKKYGVLVGDLRLLSRAVFVVDNEGIIRYVELVKVIGNEPDYNKVLDFVRQLV